jgi:hypothetical protein
MNKDLKTLILTGGLFMFGVGLPNCATTLSTSLENNYSRPPARKVDTRPEVRPQIKFQRAGDLGVGNQGLKECSFGKHTRVYGDGRPTVRYKCEDKVYFSR